MPRFHWSTTGCTLLGLTARIRTLARLMALGSTDTLNPVAKRMLLAVTLVEGAVTWLLMRNGGLRKIWSSLPARSNSLEKRPSPGDRTVSDKACPAWPRRG